MVLTGLKYIVVGTGFSGAVIANKIAANLGEKVLVIDKREHLGGNCYSEVDSDIGIECHVYGSHIFHTSKEHVWRYINEFCEFNSYRHRVLTKHQGKIYPMPINLDTINCFFGTAFTPAQAEAFVQSEADKVGITNPQNLEAKAQSLIGRRLYNAFIEGYTVKQWEVAPAELPESIITRLPVRFNYKTDYFDDLWQGIPLDGYSSIFTKMLNHSNISILLNTDFFNIRGQIPSDCCIIFTGPIDHFFDYKYGKLGWRTQRFEKEIHPVKDFQGNAVINYADQEVPFTRIHEFRHYHEERHYQGDKTVIYKEFAIRHQADTDPYYPINTSRDISMLKLYQAEAAKSKNVLFCGRLGTYRYINMDQTIDEALDLYETHIKPGRSQC
jgi:UDP-galactopyranose mutase